MKRPALFLDRDGVINIDHGYVHMPENFSFIEGIFDIVSFANHAGYLVVVVTNQAGVGRGYYTEEQFYALTRWMVARFSERGGQIDAVYFCPYHPEQGIGDYRRESSFRKPAPGMLLQAKMDLGIDLERSIIIGDRLTDMIAGRAAGVGTLLHLTTKEASGDFIVIKNLFEALVYIR